MRVVECVPNISEGRRPEIYEAVAAAAQQLRTERRALLKTHKLTLRELYRSLEQPGKHPLKEAHETLDSAVRAAYGMGRKEDPLAFLLRLNGLVAKAEAAGEHVTGPGLPASARGSKKVMSADCVRMPG